MRGHPDLLVLGIILKIVAEGLLYETFKLFLTSIKTKLFEINSCINKLPKTKDYIYFAQDRLTQKR